MTTTLAGCDRMLTLLATVGLTAIASPAIAQTCWVYRPGVPDFDQKRQGLGNDGKNYCVPTSWTNWLAYYQDNGYSGLMGMPGIPVDWQTWSHNYVTNRIDMLGTAMGTDPFGGTAGSEQDFIAYVNDQLWTPAFMLRWADGIWPEDGDTAGPNPKAGAAMLKMGASVVMTIGWSTTDSTGRVWKDGSHVVSLNGVYGLCSSQKSVRYRDPGTDSLGSLIGQSSFVSEMSTATPWSGLMRFGGNPQYLPTSAHTLDAYGDRKAYLFGFRAMLLNFGIGIDTESGGLMIHRPQSISQLTLPDTERVDFPGTSLVHDFAFLPNMAEGVAVVGGTRPELWKLDLAFGEHVKLADLTRAGPVTTSRFGDVYVADGPNIRQFDPREEREIGFVAPGIDVMALVYDDATDEVLGVGIERGELTQISRDLRSVAKLPLPSGTPVSPDLSMDINPTTGKLWISAGDGSVREIARPASGPLSISALKTLPGIARAERFRFLPDGGVIVSNGAGPVEFILDPSSGRFVPGNASGFAAGPIDSLFTTGRSRDDTPVGREREIDPEALPPGPTPMQIRDCVADIDASGEVDLGDFLSFFGCYDTLQECANLDFNREVDLGDFLKFFVAYDAGC